MMKRILTPTLLLAALFASLLSGCTKDDKPEKSTKYPIPIVIIRSDDPTLFRAGLNYSDYQHIYGESIGGSSGNSMIVAPFICYYIESLHCLRFASFRDNDTYQIEVKNQDTGESSHIAYTSTGEWTSIYLTMPGKHLITFTHTSGITFIGEIDY